MSLQVKRSHDLKLDKAASQVSTKVWTLEEYPDHCSFPPPIRISDLQFTSILDCEISYSDSTSDGARPVPLS
ncbi:hypothetical protein ACLOJK_000878 [Asimina triloba]